MQLVRRFAAASVLAEQMEGRLANGEQIDIAEHAQLSSTLVRLTNHLGLDRVPLGCNSYVAGVIDGEITPPSPWPSMRSRLAQDDDIAAAHGFGELGLGARHLHCSNTSTRARRTFGWPWYARRVPVLPQRVAGTAIAAGVGPAEARRLVSRPKCYPKRYPERFCRLVQAANSARSIQFYWCRVPVSVNRPD